MPPLRPAAAILLSLILCGIAAPSWSEPGYDQPPKNILDVMLAPSPPVPFVNPTHDAVLLVYWQDYPSITRVAKPYLRLAGVRVEPGNHSKHDTPAGYGITPCVAGFELVRIADRRKIRVAIPAAACPGEPLWSADGKRFAFANIAADAVELWIGDAVERRGASRYRACGSTPCSAAAAVDGRPKDPAGQARPRRPRVHPRQRPLVPSGPSIQETGGQKGQSSTYEMRDTLKSKHDEDLFDYYAASQLALVDTATGEVTPLGQPAPTMGRSPRPTAEHMLVATIHRPYSYVTTYDRFRARSRRLGSRRAPSCTGRVAAARRPRADPRRADRAPRFAWRATEPATLVWAEALDGGDWNVKVRPRATE